MAKQHGRHTYISVGSDDISTMTNTSELTRGAQSHDLTMYGDDYEVHGGGLKNGKFTCGGRYDNTAGTGTAAVFNPLIGETVEIVRRPEGTGTGKPEQTFDGLLVSYVETSPVADYVAWSAEFTVSGGITNSVQA
ncbi:hypothetical protein ACQSSU_03155 [Micromonospora echinospora]